MSEVRAPARGGGGVAVRLACGIATPALAFLLAASCPRIIVADAAASVAVHGHGSGAAGMGRGNADRDAGAALGAVARLGERTHGVLARVEVAVADLEAVDGGQAPTASLVAVATSVSPSALAPGHLFRLLALNAAVEAPAGVPTTVSRPASPAHAVPATAAHLAAPPPIIGSLPAAVASAEPSWPSVVIAPPSTLPPPATFVPSRSAGASGTLVVGLIAFAAALAALVSIRLVRRPG